MTDTYAPPAYYGDGEYGISEYGVDEYGSPVFVGAGASVAFVGNVLTVPAPAGIMAGDLIVVTVFMSTDVPNCPATSPGLYEAARFDNDTTAAYALTKIADGTETEFVVTVTGGTVILGGGYATAWSGISSHIPFSVATSVVAGSTSHVIGPVTPTVDRSLLLFHVVTGAGATVASMDLIVDDHTGSSLSQLWSEVLPDVSTVSRDAVTSSPQTVVGLLLAFTPLPPPPPAPVETPIGTGGGVTIDYQVFRATIDNEILEEVSNLGLEGSISMNLDRDIKLSAQITIPEPHRVDPYLDFLAIFQRIDYDDATPTLTRQMGLYAIRVPPATIGPDHAIATFGGEDLTSILANSGYTAPDEVPSGTLFRQELIDTCAEVSIARTAFPDTSRVTGYNRTYPVETTRLQKLTRLTDRMGMYQPFMDLEGRIATLGFGAKAAIEPFMTVTDADLMAECEIQPSDLQVANTVVVYRDNPAEPPLRGVAVNDDPASPISTVSRGYDITRYIAVTELENQADANKRAAVALESAMSFYRTAKITVRPDVAIGLHQTVDLALTGKWASLNGRWYVRTWNLGFDPKASLLVLEINQITESIEVT